MGRRRPKWIYSILAMKSGAIIRADGRHIAPNVYTLMVSADSLPQWKEPHLLETLVEVLKATAQEAGLQFDAPPALTIAEDPRLLAGDFNLIASNKIEPMGSDTENTGDNEDDPESIPENAFLIVEGVKVFPLNQVVVNIGRRLDNTLVIDDPRVSRNHAQLRSIKGRYVVFDLNSTGGTFVNGQRSSQSVLYPGDVISLAGVTLTALRLVHVPAVWVVAVLLPACTFRQSLPRPKLRAAAALAVSVGSTLVLQLCYQETVCILKQREPAYHRPLPDGRHSANVETRRRR